MNQSTFESMSRVLLAIAVFALAGAFAFGGNHDAIAQAKTAQCEMVNTKKEAAAAMDSMLAAGKTGFIMQQSLLCGW